MKILNFCMNAETFHPDMNVIGNTSALVTKQTKWPCFNNSYRIKIRNSFEREPQPFLFCFEFEAMLIKKSILHLNLQQIQELLIKKNSAINNI